MNKFNYLKNFLKNQIFEFLEFKEIIKETRFLSTKTYIFFKDPKIKNIINYTLTNITKLLDKIDIEEEKLSLIKTELSQFIKNETYLDKICAYLLKKKYNKAKKI